MSKLGHTRSPSLTCPGTLKQKKIKKDMKDRRDLRRQMEGRRESDSKLVSYASDFCVCVFRVVYACSRVVSGVCVMCLSCVRVLV